MQDKNSAKQKIIIGKIKAKLQSLIDRNAASCTAPEFADVYAEALFLFDEFVAEHLRAEDLSLACGAGCGVCCRHWTEDVYSFEAERLSVHIRANRADEIPELLSRLEEDERLLANITSVGKEGGIVSDYNMAMIAFYNLDRPCPLIDATGSCTVYPLRPMICRAFVNTAEPANCLPENFTRKNSGAMIILLDYECEEMLNFLHIRYSSLAEDMGLRSQLKRLLSAKSSM